MTIEPKIDLVEHLIQLSHTLVADRAVTAARRATFRTYARRLASAVFVGTECPHDVAMDMAFYLRCDRSTTRRLALMVGLAEMVVRHGGQGLAVDERRAA